MAKIPFFSSTPRQVQPPPEPVKQVTLQQNATTADKLQAVRTLLPNGRSTDDRLYATKVDGETVLYVAPHGRQTGALAHDQGFRTVAERAHLARQEIGDIYRACVDATIGGDTTTKGHQHHPKHRSGFFKGLLDRAIDTMTDTQARQEGFAQPEAAGETGGGRRAFSLPGMRYMRAVGLKLGFITPPPARDETRDMGVAELSNLNKVITNFTNRFERHAEAFAKRNEAYNRTPPPFPESNSKEVPLLTAAIDGAPERYPILQIDGQQFMPAKKLGSGGYGQVLRYEGVGTGETKVVKLAKTFVDNPELSPAQNAQNRERALTKQSREAAFELEAGRKYANDTSVVGFTDHVQLSDGTVALIGDDVKGDSVGGFAHKLNDAMEAGTIGRHEARLVALTLTKDAADGIVSLKENGAVHGDMKPGNQIIDADGRARLIDLGMTQSGPVFKRVGLQANDAYNSPEAEFIRTASAGKQTQTITDNAVADFMFLRELLGNDAFKPEHAGFIAHYDQYAAIELDADDYAIDNQADVFGAGVTLMRLFTGGRPSDWRMLQYLEEKFGADFETATDAQVAEAQAAVKESKAAASRNPDIGGVHGAEGEPVFAPPDDQVRDQVIDSLLNDMIAPNRERRIKPEGISAHPAMAYGAHDGTAAVGSTEVRNLIKAVAGGDPDEITAAAAALRLAHPQTEAFDVELTPPPAAPPSVPASISETDLPPPPAELPSL